MPDIIETLARMWIECDPNRGHPDDTVVLHDDNGAPHDAPRWEWFVPRAEASLEYLRERGLQIAAQGD